MAWRVSFTNLLNFCLLFVTDIFSITSNTVPDHPPSNHIPTPETPLHRHSGVSAVLLFCQQEGVKHFQLLFSSTYQGEGTASCLLDPASPDPFPGQQEQSSWVSTKAQRTQFIPLLYYSLAAFHNKKHTPTIKQATLLLSALWRP